MQVDQSLFVVQASKAAVKAAVVLEQGQTLEAEGIDVFYEAEEMLYGETTWISGMRPIHILESLQSRCTGCALLEGTVRDDAL